MTERLITLNITGDDLTAFQGKGASFVSFGETLIRDTPTDMQRLEMTRQVYLSLAGSEFTLSMLLSRFGIPTTYITRVPDNPYGWMVRDTARSQGINTDYFVWAPKAEPIGRLLYELGRTPRKSTAYYQRMFSAASKLGKDMVDWKSALRDCRLFHTSGISFGLAYHSKYDHNPILEAFNEAMTARPPDCLVGMDFNYRATLWSVEHCRTILTPLIEEHVDILITTIEDMASIYGFNCGRYSADQIDKGEIGELSDDDLKVFAQQICGKFNIRMVAISIRYPDTFEKHRWESAVMSSDGFFFRSPEIKEIVLHDRLGGGDTWNGGFYYGLLTCGFNPAGIEKGVLVGDAATRIKQTMMFDLPVVTKVEVQELLKADIQGGGKRVAR
jgi:2-dehydro-3-deoxygluconokinase